MSDLEFIVKVDTEDQGKALDWVLEQYKQEDLLSIMHVKSDEEGHHFRVILRSKKTPETK